MTRFTLPLLLLLLTTTVFGQNLRDSLSTTLLAPATVTSTRLTTNELAAPYSLSVVALPATQSGRQRLSPQEFFALVGVPANKKQWNECLGLGVHSAVAVGWDANSGRNELFFQISLSPALVKSLWRTASLQTSSATSDRERGRKTRTRQKSSLAASLS